MASRSASGLDLAAAKYIRRTADDQGITQGALAAKAGIPVDTFGRYWRAQRSMTVGDLGRIFDALGVDYAEAMEEIRLIFNKDEKLD